MEAVLRTVVECKAAPSQDDKKACVRRRWVVVEACPPSPPGCRLPVDRGASGVVRAGLRVAAGAGGRSR
jgi:hypothetical protein